MKHFDAELLCLRSKLVLAGALTEYLVSVDCRNGFIVELARDLGGDVFGPDGSSWGGAKWGGAKWSGSSWGGSSWGGSRWGGSSWGDSSWSGSGGG